MRIGAVAVDITPRKPVPLGGRTGDARIFEAVASPLEANILLMRGHSAAFVTLSIDTLFVGHELISAIESHLGGLPVHLNFVASHTHSAPLLDGGKTPLGSVDSEYVSQVAYSISEAIKETLAGDLVRGELTYGNAECREAVYRRRWSLKLEPRPPFLSLGIVMAPNAAVDIPRSLQLAVVKGQDGSPLAILWSWPCHAVAHHHWREVSSDFPGAVRVALRAETGDQKLPVLYMPGFCGDIRPNIVRSRFHYRSLAIHPFMFIETFVFSGGAADAHAFNQRVAVAAVSALNQQSTAGELTSVAARRTSIPLATLLPGTPGSLPISYLRAGRLTVLFAGAEVSSAYYSLLKHTSDEPQFVTGCANPTFGYLPTDKQIGEGGYEAGGYLPHFALAGSFNPEIQSHVVAAISGLTGLSD